MFKTMRSILLVGTAAAVMNTPVSAQTVLNVSTWLSPTHVQNTVVWPTWGKWVEEATEGRVTVNIEYSSNNPAQLFEVVEDSVADASFSFNGFVPGRFELQQIAELPGLGANAEAASLAYWRTYQKHLKAANEFDGLEVIGLFTHGPGVMHTRFPVSSLNDLKGKKIRIGGGVQAEIGKRLEVIPVAAPGNKVYELLQTGVVDGVFMPVVEQQGMRLVEIAPYVTVLPTGMYMGAFSMFISPDFMDSIDEKDAAAIRRVSGERLSLMAGAAWDKADIRAKKFSEENGGKVNLLSYGDQMSLDYLKVTDGIDQTWLNDVKDKKIDAQAALDFLRIEAQMYTAKQKETGAN
ncbi:TRAP transporter substrate-binding protein [Marinomonas algicola]|uniref:TRAP transporter substrate-binding protein n=1 Tax=Marinomonas algicola TaxID=2773454 RepID=UPI001749963E|nr:TRAP transporter substrate-binding protein [Marinomonas algicola]